MATAAVSNAIQEIAAKTGARVREPHLYVESIVYSNCRLKLEVVTNGGCVWLVRVPASYWYSHGSLAISIVAVIVAIALQAYIVQVMVVCLVLTSSLYGLTKWHNDKAKRGNPIFSYDKSSNLLTITSKSLKVPRSSLSAILAVSSIGLKSHKPEKSYGELKLIYSHNNVPESVVIAKTTDEWLKRFDDEILPFVEALQIPYIHADRAIDTGRFTIDRVA